jgi:hypothetical protein
MLHVFECCRALTGAYSGHISPSDLDTGRPLVAALGCAVVMHSAGWQAHNFVLVVGLTQALQLYYIHL